MHRCNINISYRVTFSFSLKFEESGFANSGFLASVDLLLIRRYMLLADKTIVPMPGDVTGSP